MTSLNTVKLDVFRTTFLTVIDLLQNIVIITIQCLCLGSVAKYDITLDIMNNLLTQDYFDCHLVDLCSNNNQIIRV